jgi:hypothetical protein
MSESADSACCFRAVGSEPSAGLGAGTASDVVEAAGCSSPLCQTLADVKGPLGHPLDTAKDALSARAHLPCACRSLVRSNIDWSSEQLL